jgi:hypothetical protein
MPAVAHVFSTCHAVSAVWCCPAANTDPPPINHEALTYAHAAATVRACAFPLNANMSPALLQQVGTYVLAALYLFYFDLSFLVF